MKIITIIAGLLLSFSISGQNQEDTFISNEIQDDNISISVQTQEDRKKEHLEYLQFVREHSGNPCCDTLFFQSGKPVFIIASVFSPILANPDYFYAEREKAELGTNFKDLDPTIQLLTLHSTLRFDNNYGESIDMSDLENEYVGLVFWDGKKEDHVEFLNSRTEYTEFIAERLHVNNVSSYKEKYENLLEQITAYDGIFSPAEHSAELAKAYLSNMIQDLFIKEDVSNYGIKINFDNVNQVNVTMQLEGERSDFGKLILDENKNPISFTVTYKSKSIDPTTVSYSEGIPVKLELPSRTIKFFFKNDTMIVKRDYLDYEFYSLENSHIKRHLYDFSIYPKREYRIFEKETKRENDCINTSFTDSYDKKCFSNTEGKFPLIVTEYVNSDKYYRKNIVEQITPNHFRVTTIDIDEERNVNEKDPEADYIRDIYINEKGNISTMSFKRKDEKGAVTLDYDYVYFR